MCRVWETELLYSSCDGDNQKLKKGGREVCENVALYPFFMVDRKGEVTISNSLK